MNRTQRWAARGMEDDAAATAVAQGAEIIEAVLSWRDSRGDNVLARKEVALGAAGSRGKGSGLAIGEETDLLVPADVLGYERFEVVRFDGSGAVAVVPPGGKLRVDGWGREVRQIELTAGHQVEVVVGAFVVRLSRVRAGTRLAGAPLLGLGRGGLGIVLGSALAHLTAFAVLAYVSPALGAIEGDAYDTDRIMLMQKLLDASAQHEIVRPPGDADTSAAGGETASRPAKDAEGQAGKDTPRRDGKWAAKGAARPETATLPRETEKDLAASFGIISLIATARSSLGAPAVRWDTALSGTQDQDRVGNLYGGSFAEAMGTGGLRLSGDDQGGDGPAQIIGLGDRLGSLGGTGTCVGDGPCDRIGAGLGRPGAGHVSKAHVRARDAGPVSTNGHLPSDVIQRIVRQNSGRYRFCYEKALRANPTLSGRVSVKFLIGRDGSVGFAADAGSDLPDAGVRQCVVSSFTALSFPAPDSGIVTVTYPLMFTPE